MVELLCRTDELPVPCELLRPAVLDMDACATTTFPAGSYDVGHDGQAHCNILAEDGDPAPMAFHTIYRQARRRDPREEPDALARTSGSVRGARGDSGPYRHKMCRVLIERAESSISVLKEKDADLEEVLRYLADAQRQIDQVDSRLWKGEVIPHDEKVFSIHEPHTRWITKGKAGVIAELGLPVCVLEDQHQLILWHQILHEGVDSDMIVGFMKEAKDRYPAITSCSMDKGYSSVKNRKALEQVLDTVNMPKRGRLSKADKERESDPKFVEGRRQHPAVESAINNLNHRGLGLIRTRGKEGFVRTVALIVVAANVHRIGQMVKQNEERRRRCEQARKRAA